MDFCIPTTIRIVKLENGNIEFYDAVTGLFIKSLSPDIVRIETVGDTVKIIQDNGSVERIHKDNVVSTQILPAAAVAFAGSAADLATLLSGSFFFVTNAAAAGGYPIDYPAGYYINFNHVGATTGANFVAPNFYYGAIQEVLTEVEITAPRIRIPGGAVGNGIVALYRFDGAQWVLVDQTAPFNTNVVGVTVLAWSTGNLILQPGVYCWCTNTSAGNSFETINGPLCSYFGYPNTMNSEELSLQLHPSAYTGVALATMPLALSAAGFVPNILNLIV